MVQIAFGPRTYSKSWQIDFDLIRYDKLLAQGIP